jgi:hypothetical protein
MKRVMVWQPAGKQKRRDRAICQRCQEYGAANVEIR